MKYLTFTTPGGSTIRAINAKSYWLRLRGLIGRKLAVGEGLLLSPCNQIHTFFMAYPIDALYLDPAYRILRIDTRVAPWRLCQRAKGCRYILELPAASAAALGITSGDVLGVNRDMPAVNC
jgi:uncharacterized protein